MATLVLHRVSECVWGGGRGGEVLPHTLDEAGMCLCKSDFQFMLTVTVTVVLYTTGKTGNNFQGKKSF